MLDVQDLLDDVYSPHVLLRDLVALDVGNTFWLEIFNTLAICHKKNVSQVGPCGCSNILFSQVQKLAWMTS